MPCKLSFSFDLLVPKFQSLEKIKKCFDYKKLCIFLICD